MSLFHTVSRLLSVIELLTAVLKRYNNFSVASLFIKLNIDIFHLLFHWNNYYYSSSNLYVCIEFIIVFHSNRKIIPPLPYFWHLSVFFFFMNFLNKNYLRYSKSNLYVYSFFALSGCFIKVAAAAAAASTGNVFIQSRHWPKYNICTIPSNTRPRYYY